MTKYLSKNILITLIVLFVHFFINAQTMYVFEVVDITEGEDKTGNANWTLSRKSDDEAFNSLFKAISDELQMKYVINHYSGTSFTKEKILYDIDNLTCNKGDIIIFCSSIHGYNNGKAQWPTICLKDGDLDLSLIIDKIKKKKAKFSLIINSSCNRYNDNNLNDKPLNDNNIDNLGKEKNGINQENINIKYINNLFINFHGRLIVIVTSSKPGQFSFSDHNNGSEFIMEFERIMMNLNNSLSWNDVLNTITKDFSNKAETSLDNGEKYRQNPIYSVITIDDPSELAEHHPYNSIDNSTNDYVKNFYISKPPEYKIKSGDNIINLQKVTPVNNTKPVQKYETVNIYIYKPPKYHN